MSATLLALLGAAGRTSIFGDGDCVAVGVSGLHVSVLDARTRSAPQATPALVVTDGLYRERYDAPNVPGSPNRFIAALERPGTYDILVQVAGYRDWMRRSVRVEREGACNYLRPVTLTADVEPLAP